MRPYLLPLRQHFLLPVAFPHNRTPVTLILFPCIQRLSTSGATLCFASISILFMPNLRAYLMGFCIRRIMVSSRRGLSLDLLIQSSRVPGAPRIVLHHRLPFCLLDFVPYSWCADLIYQW